MWGQATRGCRNQDPPGMVLSTRGSQERPGDCGYSLWIEEQIITLKGCKRNGIREILATWYGSLRSTPLSGQRTLTPLLSPGHSPGPALGISALKDPGKSFSCVPVPTGHAGRPVSMGTLFPEWRCRPWFLCWYLLVQGLCRVSLT